MTAQPTALPHPLSTGVQRIEAALDSMPIGSWDGLDELVVKDLVPRLMRVIARATAHQVAGTRALDESGLARRSGATSTGAMLAKEFGGDRASGDRMVRTGKQLSKARKVEEALAQGKVTERQAKVIAGRTSGIKASEELKERCQQQLIDEAGDLSVKDLERRADRITDVFKPKPDVDAEENETLAQREARAWAQASFKIWDRHDGTHAFEGVIPEAQGDKLKAAVDHLAAPRREHLHEQPGADRMGRAFAELCDRLTAENLMDSATVAVVTIEEETLAGKVKAATLSTGTRISASEARLTACRSKILPAVMGGKSLTLDLGRAQRLFTKAQKLALGLRDRGCAFPGCDRPPEWCEGHHITPWSRGGKTNIADGVLLCAHHHRTVHAHEWDLRRADDGIVEFRAPGTTRWQRHARFRT